MARGGSVGGAGMVRADVGSAGGAPQTVGAASALGGLVVEASIEARGGGGGGVGGVVGVGLGGVLLDEFATLRGGAVK